ncbi:MAG TPA: peroxiredoxin family protein [Nitrospirales bacterium]|jgi:cytochrome c biogenesis protein CcmG/thiol:disulfide interchange protein DsbE
MAVLVRQSFHAVLLFLVLILCSASLLFAKGFFKVGDPAPNFTLETLDGQTLSLSQYKGKVVVLGLFHICEPCLIQGTELQKVNDAFKGNLNVQVLGINSAGNSKEKVKDFLKEFPVKVTYPYMTDPKKETDKLYGGGKFIPNVYVIDQAGVIRWQRVGTMEIGAAETIKAEVDKLLSNPAKTGGV